MFRFGLVCLYSLVFEYCYCWLYGLLLLLRAWFVSFVGLLILIVCLVFRVDYWCSLLLVGGLWCLVLVGFLI